MKAAAELLKQDFTTIGDLIRAHAAERPEASALICGPRRVTYAELDELTDRVAGGLQSAGLRVGDIISICATTSVEYCGLLWCASCWSGRCASCAVVDATGHRVHGRRLRCKGIFP
jgi:acyl-CoA synthetase (AMP-forming)/AMP-acid ligase II